MVDNFKVIRVNTLGEINLTPCVATIGNFDGCHLGHQKLINKVISNAKQLNLIPTVITFFPNPVQVIKPHIPFLKLSTLSDKLSQFKKLGIERVIILKFTDDFHQSAPEKFVERYLVNAFQIKHLCIGSNFRFGNQKKGDVNLLLELGRKFGFVCDVISVEGIRSISSSLIRQSLLAGDCSEVNELLGRPYHISGRVIHGQGLASQWGVPTANIAIRVVDQRFKGIFAVRITYESQVYCGVANIGTRPTLDGKEFLLEVHVFDFNCNLYGEKLKIEFLHKISDEKRFESVDELLVKINQDIILTKQYFNDSILYI